MCFYFFYNINDHVYPERPYPGTTLERPYPGTTLERPYPGTTLELIDCLYVSVHITFAFLPLWRGKTYVHQGFAPRPSQVYYPRLAFKPVLETISYCITEIL